VDVSLGSHGDGLSTGIDCEATDRFEGLLKNRAFLERVFTAVEVERCLGLRDPAHALAGYFAAKEACLKALGTGLAAGVRWRDMEVTYIGGGRYTMTLTGAAGALVAGDNRARISISWGAGLAVAMVVIG